MKRVFSLLGWFFVLAIAAVGLRNFEEGLSIDAPLYATIARNLATGLSSSWWNLQSTIPEFQPYFADHPHLSFWTLAAIFKVLPAADWTARLPSQISYVLSLLLLCIWVAELARSRRSGVIAALLFWLFPILGNYFSNGYMDSQAFLYGSFAVFAFDRGTRTQARWHWPLWAGLGLAACALTKGFTVLGFGLPMAYLALTRLRFGPVRVLRATLICLGILGLILGIYAFALSQSEVPDFLTTYFHRQWTKRFAVASDWGRLLNGFYYKELARETHWLLALVPLALLFWRRRAIAHWVEARPLREAWVLPLLLWSSFTAMYVPAGRIGQQYWIMILPWAAWLLAIGLDALLPDSWTERRMRSFSIRFALVVVIAVQLLPVKVHHSRQPPLAQELHAFNKIWIPGTHDALNEQRSFIGAAEWAWYANRPVGYLNLAEILSGTRALPKGDALVTDFGELSARRKLTESLESIGLCLGATLQSKAYWRHCS